MENFNELNEFELLEANGGVIQFIPVLIVAGKIVAGGFAVGAGCYVGEKVVGYFL